jgi:hypothetical protein
LVCAWPAAKKNNTPSVMCTGGFKQLVTGIGLWSVRPQFSVCTWFSRLLSPPRFCADLVGSSYESRIHVNEVDVSPTVGEVKLCASKIIIATENNWLAHDRRYGPLVYSFAALQK